MDFEAIAEYLNQFEQRQAVWLLLAAFALLVLEEAPQFTAWANRYVSARFTRADFPRNNSLGMALTLGLCAAVAYSPHPAIVFAFFALAVWQCGFNTLFHVATTAVYGTYSPGLITSLVLYPRLVLYLSRLAMREELLSENAALAAMLLSGVFHAGVVAGQVYFINPVRPIRAAEMAYR